MGTPLYSTDIKTVPNRLELSALDAGDFYLVYDTSTGKISRISKTNAHAELEKLANKKSTLLENSEIYYPNQKAVNDGLNTKTSKSQIAYDNDSTTFIANTLASGAIIERGSNANGNYTKFADGTLLCYGSIVFTLDSPVAGGAYFSPFPLADYDLSPQMPASYVGSAHVNVVDIVGDPTTTGSSARADRTAVYWHIHYYNNFFGGQRARNSGRHPNGYAFQMESELAPGSVAINSIILSYKAIGRWK